MTHFIKKMTLAVAATHLLYSTTPFAIAAETTTTPITPTAIATKYKSLLPPAPKYGKDIISVLATETDSLTHKQYVVMKGSNLAGEINTECGKYNSYVRFSTNPDITGKFTVIETRSKNGSFKTFKYEGSKASTYSSLGYILSTPTPLDQDYTNAVCNDNGTAKRPEEIKKTLPALSIRY